MGFFNIENYVDFLVLFYILMFFYDGIMLNFKFFLSVEFILVGLFDLLLFMIMVCVLIVW